MVANSIRIGGFPLESNKSDLTTRLRAGESRPP
jgi:hypothetical protein